MFQCFTLHQLAVSMRMGWYIARLIDISLYMFIILKYLNWNFQIVVNYFETRKPRTFKLWWKRKGCNLFCLRIIYTKLSLLIRAPYLTPPVFGCIVGSIIYYWFWFRIKNFFFFFSTGFSKRFMITSQTPWLTMTDILLIKYWIIFSIYTILRGKSLSTNI